MCKRVPIEGVEFTFSEPPQVICTFENRRPLAAYYLDTWYHYLIYVSLSTLTTEKSAFLWPDANATRGIYCLRTFASTATEPP